MRAKTFWVKAFPAACAIVLAAGLGMYLYRFYLGTQRSWPIAQDYSFIWRAGRTWTDGTSPYLRQLPTVSDFPFVYPPNWYAPARLLALFDAPISNLVWLALSLAFLLFGSWMFASALAAHRDKFSSIVRTALPLHDPCAAFCLACLFAGYVCLTKGAGVGAYLGQTGLLVFFGLALVTRGATRGLRWPVVVGLTMMLLKPQIGLVYAIALFFTNKARLSVVLAGAITLTLALPGLFVGGTPLQTTTALINGIAAYSQHEANAPDAMSGARNLFFHALHAELSTFLCIALAAMAALALWRPLERAIGSDRSLLALLIATTLGVGLFVPLHDYDFVAILPVLGLACFLRGVSFWLVLCAALLPSVLFDYLENFLSAESGWLAHQRTSSLALSIAMIIALVATSIALRRLDRTAQR